MSGAVGGGCAVLIWAVNAGANYNLDKHAGHVIAALGSFADAAGYAFPSLPLIAWKCGLSERTCHTAVHRLAARGLIVIGRGKAHLEYWLQTSLPFTPRPRPASSERPAPRPLFNFTDPAPLHGVQDTGLSHTAEPLHAVQDTPPAPLHAVQDVPAPIESAPLHAVQPDPCTACNPTLARGATKLPNELSNELLPSLRSGKAREAQPDPRRSAASRKASRTRKHNRIMKRGARIPDSWALTDRLRAFAVEHGRNPDQCAGRFIDHWRASDEKTAWKNDWDAAFRQWVRKSVERKQDPLNPAQVVRDPSKLHGAAGALYDLHQSRSMNAAAMMTSAAFLAAAARETEDA